ncbi:MAG: CHAT domain-containing protein [Bryobacterales bacterium]|nr:CHAT domain-containing protein [Bryobacterales bacterium]
MREALDDDVLLLWFLPGEDRSYLWAVTRDRWSLLRLAPGRTLERAARRLRELAGARPGSGGRDSCRQAAAELSRLLLAPVARRMWRTKLVIAAAGALQTVPFGTPPDPVTGRPLIESRQISLTPSVSTLLAVRRLRVRAQKSEGVAIFADPVYSADDPRLKPIEQPTALWFDAVNWLALIHTPYAARMLALSA